MPSRVKTALDLKSAIESAPKMLKAIGYQANLAQGFRDNWSLDESDIDEEDEEDEEDDDDAEKESDESGVQKVDKEMMTHVKKLHGIEDRHYPKHAHGTFKKQKFSLRITKSGCEFSGTIDSSLKILLPQWFKYADISGFGNMRALKTQVNPDVRAAREIPAGEFNVGPDLLHKIEETWGKHFAPSAVRAEPYKIHLYGPKGQFKSHLDTPETGLVGTFLLGLGDSTSPSERFEIQDEYYSATVGSWVAFYPDTEHEVLEISSGHRAVIAFKIFHADSKPSPKQDTDRYAEPLKLIGNVLEKLKQPFGIQFTHQYCKSMTVPSGMDVHLLAAARALPGVVVHTLPVLTAVRSTILSYDGCRSEAEFSSNVFPLTDAHLNFLLGDSSPSEDGESVKWLDGLKKVPFYSVGSGLGETWSHVKHEGCEYTGNEARPDDEDSIYLTHAMVVLPSDYAPVPGSPETTGTPDAKSEAE